MNSHEIPKLKNQSSNNIQKPMNSSSKLFWSSHIWNLKSGYWYLFVFWSLLFGISFQYSNLTTET